MKYKFIHSATLEMAKSIHAFTLPKEHENCKQWCDMADLRMSEKLREEISFFSDRFCHWDYIIDLIAEHAYSSPAADDLEYITGKIQNMNRLAFTVFFLGLAPYNFDLTRIKELILHPEGDEMSDLLQDIEKVSLLKIHNVRFFLSHIDAIKARLISALSLYWDEIFQSEWPAIDQYLTTVIKRGTQLIERNGALDYICSLHKKIYIEADRLVFEKDPPFSILCAEIREIVITPSVFTFPHLYGNIFRGKVNIALNMNYQAVKLNSTVPYATLQLLHVIADETRFRIIKALWNGDKTTSELAELLTLSQSTVSLHLKLMKSAGLVDVRKQKKNSYYTLDRNRIYGIQESLLESLEKN